MELIYYHRKIRLRCGDRKMGQSYCHMNMGLRFGVGEQKVD